MAPACDTGVTMSEATPVRGLYEFCLQKPVSTTYRIPSIVSEVSAIDFEEALGDSRATVTVQMEQEYKKMQGELKKRAAEGIPIGFIHEGMVSSTRDAKHD